MLGRLKEAVPYRPTGIPLLFAEYWGLRRPMATDEVSHGGRGPDPGASTALGHATLESSHCCTVHARPSLAFALASNRGEGDRLAAGMRCVARG
jgi:hypothetical protein